MRTVGFLLAILMSCSLSGKEGSGTADIKHIKEQISDHLDKCSDLYLAGKLKEAQFSCEKAYELATKHLSEKEHLHIKSINDLSVVYSSIDKYPEAEKLILKILNIYKNNEKDYMSALHNLAYIYYKIESYKEAEKKYIEAIVLKKKYFPKDHSFLARSKNGLAEVYKKEKDFQKANILYEKAIALWKKSGSENDMIDMAKGLSNLGTLYEDVGYPEIALEKYKNAIEIFKKYKMTNTVVYAVSLNNIASIYHKEGKLTQAEQYYGETLEIFRSISLTAHTDYAKLLNSLSMLYFQGRKMESARSFILSALPVVENHIQSVFSIMIEKERMTYLSKNRHYFDLYLSLFNTNGSEKETYNTLLKWKGAVLNSMKQQKEFLDEKAAKDPEFRKKLDDYQDILHYQSMLITRGAVNEYDKKELETAIKKREELERDFARQDASYRKEKELQKITVDNICGVLKPDEAIIDYLKYKKSGSGNNLDVTASYLAFVVKGGKGCSSPVRIELGIADEIEKLTDEYRKLFENPKEKANDPTDTEGIAFKLMKKIWRPLEESICDRKKVWIIPDGALGGVSFQTLKTGTNEYLTDNFEIRYLDNSADIYRAVSKKQDLIDKSALFVKNINFGEASKEEDVCFPKNYEGLIDKTNYVQGLFNKNKIITNMLEDSKATKPAVFQALRSSPVIVDISTHGFYKPDECVVKYPEELADPMSRSGIVFAGVNDPKQKVSAIATGIDFSGLNLRKTDLFVLSACQSGMGGMTEGEGVVGMRRALSMAGVRTIVSMLWDAEDTMTKQIMQEFYDGYLKTGKPHETMRMIQKKYRAEHPDKYLLWGFLAVSGATE